MGTNLDVFCLLSSTSQTVMYPNANLVQITLLKPTSNANGVNGRTVTLETGVG